MLRRTFGRTGMEVSVLGFGGSEIGYQGVEPAQVERLLNEALDAGLNVLDTAECYRDSEEKIGRAVGHRRQDFYLFTKCGHASGFEEPDWDPAMLAKQIDRSLQRLRTDAVDLVQLHSCGEDLLRTGDVVDVLRRAKEAGKTRFIGYSGDGAAAAYAVASGAFDALQTSCNLADQECVDTTLPAAATAGMGVIAKRPLANAAWLNEPAPGAYARPYWERLQKLDYPPLREGGAASVAFALRFTLAQPGICTMIVGTTKPGRWQSNAELVASGPLEPEALGAIRERWLAAREPDWVGLT